MWRGGGRRRRLPPELSPASRGPTGALGEEDGGGDDGDGASVAPGEEEDGGEVAATGEGDVAAPDEPAELPSDGLSCIGRVDSAMARAGAATERAAGSLVYPHNADAGAEKDPKEKGTESSHSAAATDCGWSASAKVVGGYEGDDEQQRQK